MIDFVRAVSSLETPCNPYTTNFMQIMFISEPEVMTKRKVIIFTNVSIKITHKGGKDLLDMDTQGSMKCMFFVATHKFKQRNTPVKTTFATPRLLTR